MTTLYYIISKHYNKLIPLELIEIIQIYIYQLYYLDIIYLNNNNNWSSISYTNLNEDFLLKYYNKIIWKYKIINQQLSEKFLIQLLYQTYIIHSNLQLFLLNQQLSENFINILLQFFNKKYILKYILLNNKINLSDNFIILYENDINFNLLFKKKLSPYIINQYYYKLNWNYLTETNFINCSPELLEIYCNNIFWKTKISKFNNLSKQFFVKYINKLDITHIINNCKFKISDSIIIKYYKTINFYRIININNLSNYIINKYKYNFNWDNISINCCLSEKIINSYKIFINWCSISKFQTLSENFIYKYIKKLNWNYLILYQTFSNIFIRKHINIIYKYLNSFDIQYQFHININNFPKDILIFIICIYNEQISNNFIYANKHIINKYIYLINNMNILYKFLDKYKNETNILNWNTITNICIEKNYILTHFKNYIDWNIISQKKCFDIINIKPYIYYVNWNIIFSRFKLKKQLFINMYKDLLLFPN